MSTRPHLVLDRLLMGPEATLFAIGSVGDQVCALLSLDLRGLTLRWSRDLGEESTGCQVEQVGEALWVHGLPTGGIVRFHATSGEPLRPLELPGVSEALEIAADHDGSALVAGEPRMDLRRFDSQGSPLTLWPRPPWVRRMLLGRGGGHVFNVPVARPTGLIPPARLGSGGDGALRLAGAGCVARLEPDGHLSWVARLPEATAPLTPPRASLDGTTWALFTRGDAEVGLYRIAPDGSGGALQQTGWFTDLAVAPEGQVYLSGGGTLRCLHPDGRLESLW